MANVLINFVKQLLSDTKKAASNEDVLEGTKGRLQILSQHLDVQLRGLRKEWTAESGALLEKPPALRMMYYRLCQKKKQRLTMVGQQKMVVESCLMTLQAAKDQIDFEKILREGRLPPEKEKLLRSQLQEASVIVKTSLDQVETLEQTLEATSSILDGTLPDSNPAEEARMAELFERYETCKAAGDEEGMAKAKEEMKALDGAAIALFA